MAGGRAASLAAYPGFGVAQAWTASWAPLLALGKGIGLPWTLNSNFRPACGLLGSLAGAGYVQGQCWGAGKMKTPGPR